MSLAAEPMTSAKPATARFERRKEAILAAAIAVLNQQGIRGMTLAEVAERVGLTTTSVTYYYRKKEDLAVACFRHGLERFERVIDEAAAQPDLAGRLKRLLQLHFQLQARVRAGDEPPLTIFSDMRALSEPLRTEMGEVYRALFFKVRDMFMDAGDGTLERMAASMRAHVLMEQLFWSAAWLQRYDLEDFDRACERMFDILAGGLCPAASAWAPMPITVAPPSDGDAAMETFLRAATPLINQRGYRGVSVTEIAARLNVTKGSFYHHMDGKDDVVVACMRRAFETIRAAQLAAQAATADPWGRLSSIVAALVARQLDEDGLLLRISALQALPEPLREAAVRQGDRVWQRFVSIIADGVAAGALRPVDPVIAAQMVSAAINAAADLILWDTRLTPEEAEALYARPALMGLLAH